MCKHILLNNTVFSCLLCTLLPFTLLAGWHERKAEGWSWYEDQRKSDKEGTIEEPSPNSTEQIVQVRKNLEEKLAAALLEPTPENIRLYMEEQQKWVERSSHFAQVWAQLLLNHPHLDYTATSIPVSQYGLQLYKQNLQEEKEKLIASLVNDYGLFFFYEGQNEASALFGRIVQELAKKYGWETIAISIDGVELQGVASRKDNGIVQTLGIDLVPALYLINPKTNIAIPVAFGLVAMDQIENNIALQFKELNP
jgi:conjugal transfer pilus assembly protein TraF